MLQRFFILIFLAFHSFFIAAQPPSNAYKLVHFNDFSNDSTNMGDDIPKDFPLDNGNISGTYSYPIKKNVYQKNGMLHAAVIYENTPHPNNANAPIRNFSGADWHEFVAFRYGYFETKLKITKLDHVWGCFWLLKNGGLGRYQEIDIMECFTAAKRGKGYVSASQHWWESVNSTNTKHWNSDFGDINLDSFHTYGCEWTPKTLRFYIDGTLKSTMKNYDLHDPMQIKFDVKRQKSKKRLRKKYSFGTDTTPSVLMADYIKVWQIPNAGSVYAKGQKNQKDSVTYSKSRAKRQIGFANWDNMLHVAWYPQAKYTISCPSKNMVFNEIMWPLGDGEGYNFRGELTKGFSYACNIAGTYSVKIHVSFPELGDFEEDVTFLVEIE
jgi:hypothetical protein